MFRRIAPAKGYCLFFPDRRPGERLVSGREVLVWPLEKWKHVKLGLFEVMLPDREMLIMTSERLECDVKASFWIVVGTPANEWQEREKRMELATISCAPTRSLAEKDRVDFDFFRDWAANHCRTALLNIVGQSEYVKLFEDAKYRAEVQQRVREETQSTLTSIGLLLVRCDVVITPREPSGIFATPEILGRCRLYREAVYAEDAKRLQADQTHEKDMKALAVEHAKTMGEVNAREEENKKVIEHETKIKLGDLTFALRRKEADLEVQERRLVDKKDHELGEVNESIDKRAHKILMAQIGRDAQVKQEEFRTKAELESEQLKHKLTVAQKEVDVLPLTSQLTRAELDFEEKKGQIATEAVEREALAKGAHEHRMQESMLQVLPGLAENIAAPMGKIGEIKILSMPGSHDSPGGAVGSVLSSAVLIPLFKEVLGFVQDVTQAPRKLGP